MLRVRSVELQGGFTAEGEGWLMHSVCADRASEKAKRAAMSHVGGVLVLHSASPSLRESDFRRIVPRGTHISSWKTQGDIFQGALPSPPP